MQIQVVDFQDKNAPADFTKSLRETGFGVIANHPIDFSKVTEAYREWEAFFKKDDKFKYEFAEETQDGYFPFLAESAKGQEVADLKEFFHVYPWGQYPESVSVLTKELYDEMNHFATIVLKWIEDNTPEEVKAKFSMPLSEMLTNSKRTLLRVIYYPALEQEIKPGQVRAAAHEDINLITILPAASERGLQVKDINGNWLDVPCEPNTLIINVGDMLELATEHYYPSTTHRVVNPEGEDLKKPRLSMPLFLHPEDSVKLSAEKTANEYRLERLRELGLVA